MFCSKCGKEIAKNDAFCSGCGIKLTHVVISEEKELDQETIKTNAIPMENNEDPEKDKSNEIKVKDRSILITMILLIFIAIAVTGFSYKRRLSLEIEHRRLIYLENLNRP